MFKMSILDSPDPEVPTSSPPSNLPPGYYGEPIIHGPGDADRALSHNGHNEKDLQSKYRGKVGDILIKIYIKLRPTWTFFNWGLFSCIL